jgi:hypothetical protein
VTSSPPAAAVQPALAPESFLAVVFRRTRYTIAVILSAVLFCTLGWQLAAPPPEWAGVSLVAWHNHGIFAALALAIMLLVATAVCSLLVHPDSPHMGLACALLGMAGLSIRGGTIYMLVRFAQQPGGSFAVIAQGLAVECVEWALILLIVESAGRMIHDRFFANTHWIMRTGPELGAALVSNTQEGAVIMGVALAVSKFCGTRNLPRRIATPLAMLASGALACLLLYVLMQTQHKGQVLMACLAAFFLSTLLAYLVFPRVPIVALLLTVPLTAAAAYIYGSHAAASYPGHISFFALRALPIDYVTAGVPGAVFGYYAGFRWALHSAEDHT